MKTKNGFIRANKRHKNNDDDDDYEMLMLMMMVMIRMVMVVVVVVLMASYLNWPKVKEEGEKDLEKKMQF